MAAKKKVKTKAKPKAKAKAKKETGPKTVWLTRDARGGYSDEVFMFRKKPQDAGGVYGAGGRTGAPCFDTECNAFKGALRILGRPKGLVLGECLEIKVSLSSVSKLRSKVDVIAELKKATKLDKELLAEAVGYLENSYEEDYD